MSKIAELKQYMKSDLQVLAEELGFKLETGDKIGISIRKVVTLDGYRVGADFALTYVR